MNFSGNMQIVATGERELVITREFNAPRRLVFDAYTKPELIRRWLFGPPGWSFAVCEVDFRVGGQFRYVWRKDDGFEMGMTGTYREIVLAERIVNVEIFDQDWTGGEAQGTLLFTESAAKTTMTQTMLYSSRGARDGVLQTPMAEGMAIGFDRLAELLATLVAPTS